jgi:hypothetical protein
MVSSRGAAFALNARIVFSGLKPMQQGGIIYPINPVLPCLPFHHYRNGVNTPKAKETHHA